MGGFKNNIIYSIGDTYVPPMDEFEKCINGWKFWLNVEKNKLFSIILSHNSS